MREGAAVNQKGFDGKGLLQAKKGRNSQQRCALLA